MGSCWQIEIGRLVRFLINDIDLTSTTYSDARIEETIIVAAQLVINEIDFAKSYTINVDLMELTPDPTVDTKDNGFINLVALKAACIVLLGEYKTNSASAMKISDGPSSIDTSKLVESSKQLYEDMCKQYEQAKFQHQMSSNSPGEAILTPYTNEALNPIQGNFR